jgi:anti-anti-sigma regulatory factor
LELENIPSILVSNHQGMYEAVTHLIETHNYRRIAFIRGPAGHPEAEERYRAYTEALAAFGLPLDPDLVAPGVFDSASGVGGVGLILDERKTNFDALVAVDDSTALGALEALHMRGIEVPGEVAVAGFDDVDASRLNSLPLTTVRQSLYEMGKLAVETQQQALKELSTPIIPVVDAPGGASGIIVMPLIGSIDTMRARDITRALLKGISNYRAKIVIVDITGVPIVDTGVANHLNKTFQAARLKGARTIVTGVSEAVAETIVDLGIDWRDIQTLSDLQTGLKRALTALGLRIEANRLK